MSLQAFKVNTVIIIITIPILQVRKQSPSALRAPHPLTAALVRAGVATVSGFLPLAWKSIIPLQRLE